MLFSISYMRLSLISSLVGLSVANCFGIAVPAVAQSSGKACSISNFNNDFRNWEVIGHKNLQTTKSPTNSGGENQAAFIDTFSAQTADIVELANFLNTEIDRLNKMGEVFEGSAMKTNFTVEVGEILTFDWNFLTDDFQASNNDFAFFTLAGEDIKLADTFSTFSNSLNNPTSFLHQTGFQTASYTFTTAGTYTFGVGVVDVGDGSVDSGLMIDNVSLSRPPL
ncbi:MAG: hypothetical protein WBG73_16220 [Coleofasciculaceae cyanobacterium]